MPLRTKEEGKGMVVSGFITPIDPIDGCAALHLGRGLREAGIPRISDEFVEYGKNKHSNRETVANQLASKGREVDLRKYEPLWIFNNTSNHTCKPRGILSMEKISLGDREQQPFMRDTVDPGTGVVQQTW
ncbi:hypothetical protein K470DRAFT_174801 [Piedraia hortae CBS 480.64]|uniref:Uncharacterized protein n=1 Tax=Piedraia hortae CBS 480.64 TaxID=1314780 RepID=A0A6A7C6E4_9PEZI|nr:hypothetical protein K470DRAFT_174801 [Piedraia hortae CBS 480.64]